MSARYSRDRSLSVEIETLAEKVNEGVSVTMPVDTAQHELLRDTFFFQQADSPLLISIPHDGRTLGAGYGRANV